MAIILYSIEEYRMNESRRTLDLNYQKEEEEEDRLNLILEMKWIDSDY